VSKDFKATTAALIAGDIDAMAIREPYISEAREALGENAVVFREPGLYRKTVTLFAGPDTDTGLSRRVLAALISAEDWAAGHPREAEAIIALKLDRSPAEVRDALARSQLAVMLDQALLVDLESQARWAVKYGFTKSAKIPDYLEYVRTQDLNAVKPEAMTVIE
jgi:NitT/TauT family transport system substrate-binding protein